MTKILVLDASPLIYSVFNTQGWMSTKTGIPTGLCYGFLRSLRSYEKKTKADQVAIAFDVKGPIKKAAALPEYKSDRVWTESKQKMYDQVPALREMLQLTKYTQLDAEGYEADDIIGHLSRVKAAKGDEVTIISADNDMLQLIGERISIFRPGSSKKKTKDQILDRQSVRDIFGVWPEHLLVYRSMVGDRSDHIAGVVTGEEAARSLAKYLTDTFPADKVLTIDDIKSKIPSGSAADALEIVERNYHTMSLHKPEDLRIVKGERNREKLTELFVKLEFRSMMEHINSLVSQ
jgi:DNA polymerase-1